MPQASIASWSDARCAVHLPSHEATLGVQVRASNGRSAAAPDAPLRGLVPGRVAQGDDAAKQRLRAYLDGSAMKTAKEAA